MEQDLFHWNSMNEGNLKQLIPIEMIAKEIETDKEPSKQISIYKYK